MSKMSIPDLAEWLEGMPIPTRQDVQAAQDLREMHTTLLSIASIAHCGGLYGLSESSALNAIRKITLPYWDRKTEAPHKASATFAVLMAALDSRRS